MTETDATPSQKLRQCAETQLRMQGVVPATLETVPAKTPASAEEALRLCHELQVHQIELELQNNELRSTQYELETLKDRYFELYDLAPLGYLTLDSEGRIKESNLAAASLLAVPRTILLNKPLAQFVCPEDREIYHQHRTKAFETCESQVWEMRFVRSSGGTFWANISAAPANNREYWVTLNDITILKQAETAMLALQQQFQQTQKLESLGILAGGIAHDFNNILTIIMGCCSLAKLDPLNSIKHIPAIEIASERAAELCHQMLTYAGKALTISVPVNMSAVVDEMLRMLKPTFNKNVEIKASIPDDLPMIQADISQIRQILMNLIVNASEAIGEKQGSIKVSLSQSVILGRVSDTDQSGKAIDPGWYVCLEVTDNGCGMDEETRRRIFEPFFTTKFTGRGLGMSAVLGIITAHGGALRLASVPGVGSTFTVYLPIRDCSAEQEVPVQLAPSVPWYGSGTILLVDDENDIRFVASCILEEMGFTAITASNGAEALELYRKNAAEIILVLTDVGMPVMDGYALVSALRKQSADVPIIVSSGFGDSEVIARLAGENISRIISKPYSFEQFQAVLQQTLANADQTA